MSQRRSSRSNRAALSDLLTRLGRGSERRGRVVAALLVLGFALFALALLSIPMLRMPGNASAAKDDLTAAKDALQAGDVAGAKEAVGSARDHVDAAQHGSDGIASHVWGLLPVVGGAVDDARNLVQALDDTTSVVEIGTDLYPEVAGDDATFFADNQVDPTTFEHVMSKVQEAGNDLLSAQDALQEVDGTTPVIGDTIAARRDEAAAQVDPLANGYSSAQPALDRLPSLLGFEGRRHYLIAMLNPAELRYSGGAVLSFAPITVDDGKIAFGRSAQMRDDPRLTQVQSWHRVPGNPFHHYDGNRITNATFAPSWSVSGGELIRGWRAARDRRLNGVVVIDVVGLSRLFDVTGPINVPGYGTLTADNLVETLVGSYDDYYPNVNAQDRLNRVLIPTFKRQMFNGGNYVAKGKALAQAARERHFAMYFKDADTEEAVRSLGLDGDLAQPDRDYLGAFTQNTNASKADYYQRRSLSLDVDLDRRGSASHELNVVVDNDTPPYAVPGTDPQTGYFTRWSGFSLGVFLPEGVKVSQTSANGEPRDLPVRSFYDHAFVAPNMMLAPGAQGTFQATYQLKRAATIADDGTMTYGLSMDPQGMVNPETVQVTVHLPRGYEPVSLPDGWTSTKNAVTLPATALTESQHWEIVAKPAD